MHKNILSKTMVIKKNTFNSMQTNLGINISEKIMNISNINAKINNRKLTTM